MSTFGFRALAVPLLLVACLACALGFFVARSVTSDSTRRIAQVSVVAIPPTPTPEPAPEPTAGPTAAPRSRTSRSGRSCPAGCECQFPKGGIVIICQGATSLRLP